MEKGFIIRPLKKVEIPQLKGFAPVDWNFELDKFLTLHYGRNYFIPIVTVNGSEIVAFANSIINGNAGWAGNIIVTPKFQEQGIGYAITERLIGIMQEKVQTIFLIATEAGENLYNKFGFETISSYSFFEYKKIEATIPENIQRFDKNFFNDLLKIDYQATGENRKELLVPYLKDTWIYVSASKKLNGFFVENFEDGPVVADNDIAGKALLEFKHTRGRFRSVLPTSNNNAIQHLLSLGLKETKQANRMLLGKKINWKPENIYSRGAGYCG